MTIRTLVAALAAVALCSGFARAAEPAGSCVAGGKEERICIAGTLTAVDVLSEPPSLTVAYRGTVRTIAINSSAKIVLEDVVARTEQRAKLDDLHVGDGVLVAISRDGTVISIEDRFRTRAGKIAAVSTSAIVLEGGRVLLPDRTTTIILDGQAANMSDLRAGDTVTQRMNPQTGETHEIIAVRDATPAPVSTSGATPKIASFRAEPLRPLRIGDKFSFTLSGTPGGRATYDLGTFLLARPLHEGPPGIYRATLAVTPGMNFAQMPVRAHLALAGEIVTEQAENKLSAATIAPQITDIAPSRGQIVNNNMPSIYATFAAPTELGVDPQTIVLKVNGKDVSASVTRTSSFVTYTCGTPLPDGPVSVSVAVADFAGNSTARSWTFTIRTR